MINDIIFVLSLRWPRGMFAPGVNNSPVPLAFTTAASNNNNLFRLSNNVAASYRHTAGLIGRQMSVTNRRIRRKKKKNDIILYCPTIYT